MDTMDILTQYAESTKKETYWKSGKIGDDGCCDIWMSNGYRISFTENRQRGGDNIVMHVYDVKGDEIHKYACYDLNVEWAKQCIDTIAALQAPEATRCDWLYFKATQNENVLGAEIHNYAASAEECVTIQLLNGYSIDVIDAPENNNMLEIDIYDISGAQTWTEAANVDEVLFVIDDISASDPYLEDEEFENI